jgi:hypothetical protein
MKRITMRSDFLILYEQFGVFSYAEDGFTVQLGQGARTYLYADIETILAYKVGGPGYDEMRMEIAFPDCALRIAECVPGWYQFVLHIKDAFPGIPRDWDLQIPFPSFAINLVVLYKKTE